MRKFKIKNRRKRKYVKKGDVSPSLSFTSTITIGIIPLVLTAAAFFTIYLVSNPLTMPYIPSFSMPAMPEMSFTMPELPEWKIEVTAPALPEMQPMPTIVLPDVMPLFVAGYEFTLTAITSFTLAISNAFASLMASLLSGFIAADHAAILTLQREFINAETLWTATGNLIIFSINTGVMMLQIALRTIIQALTALSIAILYAAAQTVQAINALAIAGMNALMQAMTTLSLLIIAMTNAIIKSLSDFVWFLGTPFRALGESINNINIFLAPYFHFLEVSFRHGLDDLAAGGESLRQTAIYVSENASNSQ